LKRLISVSTILLCLVLPISASAAKNPELYEVEIVVFQTKLAYLEGEELWARDVVDTKLPGMTDAVTAKNIPAIDSPLWKAAGTLEADADYDVLIHKRWLQPAETASEAKWVYLKNARTDPLQLEGTVRFYQSRFLHVDVELLLREDGGRRLTATSTADAGPMIYRISEQRRIRSRRVNYFDHPKFGALVRVAPVDKK
jgi:hypothetical protein